MNERYGILGLIERLHGQWKAWQRRRLFPESRVLVEVEADVVRCTWPGKAPNEVMRSMLQRVAIETNDKGPFACDLFWILEDTSGSCILVPKGATGEDDLVAFVQNLDGFDHMTMIMAMGSVTERVFECWRA